VTRLLALLLALVLPACQRTSADVTTFHAFPESPKGKSFMMVPFRSQVGSLEWRSYADLVAQQLEKNGLVKVDPGAAPDYGVFLNYAVDAGRTTGYSTPIVGPVSYVTSNGRTTPIYGVVGFTPSQTTLYGSTVKIVMYDVRNVREKKMPFVVFEGIGSSANPTAALNPVMPTIVAGIFTDWPGPSGQTRRTHSAFGSAPK
jgi:hypothetical protein